MWWVAYQNKVSTHHIFYHHFLIVMRRYFVFSLLFMLLLLTCCQQQVNEPLSTPERDSISLRVALLPTKGCQPFINAQKAGIYDSLGLRVEFTTYNSQFDCDTALLNGHVSVAVTDTLRMRLYQKHHLQNIMPIAESWSLVVGREAKAKHLTQIGNYTLATSRRSASEYYSCLALHRARLDFDTIFHPQVNNLQLRANMLLASQVYAAMLPEPIATEVCQAGCRRLYTSPLNDSTVSCLACLPHGIKKDEQTLLIKGYKIALSREK